MTDGDYRLFSYYWLFRLEVAVITASFCSVFVYAAIKLIMSKFTSGFAVTWATSS